MEFDVRRGRGRIAGVPTRALQEHAPRSAGPTALRRLHSFDPPSGVEHQSDESADLGEVGGRELTKWLPFGEAPFRHRADVLGPDPGRAIEAAARQAMATWCGRRRSTEVHGATKAMSIGNEQRRVEPTTTACRVPACSDPTGEPRSISHTRPGRASLLTDGRPRRPPSPSPTRPARRCRQPTRPVVRAGVRTPRRCPP